MRSKGLNLAQQYAWSLLLWIVVAVDVQRHPKQLDIWIGFGIEGYGGWEWGWPREGMWWIVVVMMMLLLLSLSVCRLGVYTL